MKRLPALLILIVLTCLLVSPGVAQDDSARTRYAGIEHAETVTLQDSKGVVTVATGFGKLFGMPYLNCYRGDSSVQVPFERIKSFTTGVIVDNRLEIDLLLTSQRRMKVLVDRPEYETLYAGTADFGYFKIRLQDIRSLTFRREAERGDAIAQKCGKGHLYYNDSWSFCPYDGTKLVVIRTEK